MKNIYEILQNPHFIIAEYMGEMTLDNYSEITKGSIKSIDFTGDDASLLNQINDFNKEWSLVVSAYEEFADGFYFEPSMAYWKNWPNLQKINEFLTGTWSNIRKRALGFSDLNDFKNVINEFLTIWDRFNNSIERLNRYIKSHNNIQKMAIATNEKSDDESMSSSDYFKPLITVMGELTNIIDERNVQKINSEQLKEFYKTCLMHIDAANEAVEMIESGDLPDNNNLLSSLKTNTTKLKLMLVQLKAFINE